MRFSVCHAAFESPARKRRRETPPKSRESGRHAESRLIENDDQSGVIFFQSLQSLRHVGMNFEGRARRLIDKSDHPAGGDGLPCLVDAMACLM